MTYLFHFAVPIVASRHSVAGQDFSRWPLLAHEDSTVPQEATVRVDLNIVDDEPATEAWV